MVKFQRVSPTIYVCYVMQEQGVPKAISYGKSKDALSHDMMSYFGEKEYNLHALIFYYKTVSKKHVGVNFTI